LFNKWGIKRPLQPIIQVIFCSISYTFPEVQGVSTKKIYESSLQAFSRSRWMCGVALYRARANGRFVRRWEGKINALAVGKRAYRVAERLRLPLRHRGR
jgi:hypothetical protein